MKESKRKYILLVSLIIIASLALSGCTGGVSTNNWPGVNADSETVYFANLSLYSLRMSDGTLKWQYPEKTDAKHMIFGQPVILDDQVLLGDYGGVLRSINPNTGTQSWSFEQAEDRYVASPVVVGDFILAPSFDGTLYALNLNGALQWKFAGEQALWVSPATDGTLVFQPSMDKKLYAIQLSDGAKVWELDLGGASVTSPVLSEDGSLLFISTLANKMLAVNTKSGSVVWEFDTPGTVWSQPLVVDGMLYFGDNSGMVHSLDTATGTKTWAVELGGAVIAGGASLPGGVAYASETGDVVLLSTDGAKVWTRTIDGELYSNLVVVEDHLLVAVMKGDLSLVCFDANGNQVWTYQPAK